jgi:hypothetical protein
LTGCRDGWYEVEHRVRGLGTRAEWDIGRIPFLWYWQEFGAPEGYPWYRRDYNTGLEPFSSDPTITLPEAIANGSALVWGPREGRDVATRASVYGPGASRSTRGDDLAAGSLGQLRFYAQRNGAETSPSVRRR